MTVRVEITQRKVYMATGKNGEPEKEVPVGTILEYPEFPEALRGKARIISDDTGKTMQTGDDLEALRAEYAELTGETPDKRWGAARIRSELETLTDPEAQ